MRVLGVDHGEKRIGLAISDETGSIARPLRVLLHVRREVDAAQVAEAAKDHDVGLIVIGQSFDEGGQPNAAGRSAGRFADALKTQTSLPIVMWDESMSTADAKANRLEMGGSRKGRAGHLDDAAAAVMLQSYLDAQRGG